jgi:carbonic anhydrase
LELHIVHTENNTPGQYSVIGLMFRVNNDLKNDVADLYNFSNADQKGSLSFPWNVRNKMFYHYKGSLTTPPCAETVEWFVITEIYEIQKRISKK